MIAQRAPLLVAAMLLAMASACRPKGNADASGTSETRAETTAASATPNPEGHDVVTIETNTQATVGDLKIFAYNFADDVWGDDAGASHRGRTCALRIFVRDKPGENQKIRVHAGETFAASGATFEVVDVGATAVHLRRK